jgi:hypothetical protein
MISDLDLAPRRVGVMVRRGDSDAAELKPPPPSSRRQSAHLATIIGLGEDLFDEARATLPFLPAHVADLRAETPRPATLIDGVNDGDAVRLRAEAEAMAASLWPQQPQRTLFARAVEFGRSVATELFQVAVDVVDAAWRWSHGAGPMLRA